MDGLQKLLSTSRADLNSENKETHLTLLMEACNCSSSNLKKVIDLLIENGAEVDCKTNGYSALMKAAENGKVEAVKCLIKHGALVDYSALEVGCKQGMLEVVKVLLEAIQDSRDVKYFDCNSAFITAVGERHIELVKWFLESGKVTGIPGDALSIAIYNQDSEMIQLLDDHHAKLNPQTDKVILAASQGKVEVVKEFLKRGVNVNMKGKGGSTALLSVLLADDHVVPQQSKIAIVKLLLEHGANADVRDNKQRNPLKCAIKTKSAEIVKLLIDKIKNLKHQLNTEKYILEEDVYSSPDVLKLLLDAGANPNITVNTYTPLLKVADVDVAKMLIDHGANVDQCDIFGESPILRAVEKSNYKLVELLLEKGADITLERESNGNSAKIMLQRNPRQILVSPFYL